MPVLIQSDYATGKLPIIAPGASGAVTSQKFTHTLTTGQVVQTNILELGVLPAYCTVVDAVLQPADLDSNGSPTITLDVGLMSGTVGDDDNTRTCGNEIFSADTGARTGAAARAGAAVPFAIAAADHDRSVGVKIAGAVATAAGGAVSLVLSIAQVG